MNIRQSLRDLFVPPPPPAAPEREFRCGVVDCRDGRVVLQDEQTTVVDCETHNAVTSHDTAEREGRPQQVIRVQDNWRQHGTAPKR